MSHHSHSASVRSQERQFRYIAWMRKTKRWLKKSMIFIIILLALAVLLSYIFITKPSEPQDIAVQKPIIERL